MAYNEFSLDALIQQFGLRVRQERDLFSHAPLVAVSDVLRVALEENVSLAVDIGTEKARSELIVMPVLLEVRRGADGPLSLFSGVEFNVDFDRGLWGVCDFLLSLSPLQLTVQAPVVAVVEAKNDNIKSGLGQCLAEMLAAQTFNARRGNSIPTVYGIVTTGTNWKFLSLNGDDARVDEREYYISEVERVVSIIASMVDGPFPTL